MTPSIVDAANFNSAASAEYPADEWRITGELIRQIAKATTWQRVIEAGDALMTVSRIAKSMRDERDHHAPAETARSQARNRDLMCQGGHEWTGALSSCCPECGRRASTMRQWPSKTDPLGMVFVSIDGGSGTAA